MLKVFCCAGIQIRSTWDSNMGMLRASLSNFDCRFCWYFSHWAAQLRYCRVGNLIQPVCCSLPWPSTAAKYPGPVSSPKVMLNAGSATAYSCSMMKFRSILICLTLYYRMLQAAHSIAIQIDGGVYLEMRWELPVWMQSWCAYQILMYMTNQHAP